MMLMTTPLWISLFFAAGQALALIHLIRGKREFIRRMPLLLCTLLWALPLGFALLSRPVVYNGWRHFYFLYGPMLALAAYGLNWLWEHVRFAWQRRTVAILLVLCAAITGVSMALNHPYQYAYYNPLISTQSVNTWLERDYWNVSIQGALAELHRSEAYRSVEGVARIGGVDWFAQTGLEQALALAEDADMIPVKSDSQPDFWLVNHTYQNFSGWKPSKDMRLVVQVKAYGQPLVSIYQLAPNGGSEEIP